MAEVKNKEHLQEIVKSMPIFKSLGKRSHIMWDVPGRQLSQEIKSRPVEFANNEIHRVLDAKSAYAYKDDDQAYIADIVAPFSPVKALHGETPAFATRTFYDRPETAAGKDTPPNLISNVSTMQDYDLTGRALAIYMSNVDRDNAMQTWGSVAAWRNILVLLLASLLRLDREMVVADIYQTTANFGGGSATASPLWSEATATILGDTATGEDAILAPKDLLVCAHNVFRSLQTNSAITGATTVSGSRRRELTPYVNQEAIENYFDCKMAVGHARYNSASETDTPVFTRVWADYVSVVHIGSGGPLATPFAKTYKLQSQAFPNSEGWSVKSVMDSSTMAGGEVVMVGYFVQEAVFASMSGYSIKGL